MIQDNLNSANESSDSPNGIQEESLLKAANYDCV